MPQLERQVADILAMQRFLELN